MSAGTRLCVLLMGFPAAAAGQSFLEEFSYEGLRFSGIGVDGGYVASDRIAAAWSPGIRIDYGLIAPNVRVVLGGSYYEGALDAAEITEFETSLRRVVTDPTGDATISVGAINWATFDAFLDLHYLFPTRGRTLWYLGVGMGMQLWNGSGASIDGTFVEDALDTIGAAAHGVAGVEVAANQTVRFLLEGRGGLTSEIRTAAARLGIMLRIPREDP